MTSAPMIGLYYQTKTQIFHLIVGGMHHCDSDFLNKIPI